jgi:hypothetical protein
MILVNRQGSGQQRYQRLFGETKVHSRITTNEMADSVEVYVMIEEIRNIPIIVSTFKEVTIWYTERLGFEVRSSDGHLDDCCAERLVVRTPYVRD